MRYGNGPVMWDRRQSIMIFVQWMAVLWIYVLHMCAGKSVLQNQYARHGWSLQYAAAVRGGCGGIEWMI